MIWHFDWPSFTIGCVATWAGALAVTGILMRIGDRKRQPMTPAERLPAVPRWAATARDDALEDEPDAIELEYQKLIAEQKRSER